MRRILLSAKLHGLVVTATELEYEGSLAVDRALLDAAGMLPGEQVHVVNLHSGSRIVTYLIEAPGGSGEVVLNGPAARTGEPGDRIIAMTYAELPDDEARFWKPQVVRVGPDNRPADHTERNTP